jgi:hypothetical protein
MREGMHAHLVPGLDFPPDKRWVQGDMCPDDEERRRDVVLPEHVENLWRPRRVRPVVEGERHGPGPGFVSLQPSSPRVDDGSQ